MSGESSKRSNLIDVSYSQLHAILSGQQDGTTIDQIIEYVTPRLEQLRNIAEPFGRPSDASRKKIDGGAAVLSDGVTLRIEDADKEYVLAVSAKFQIDQVQALVLLRSFLYNKGLPPSVGASEDSSLVDELLVAITPFYFSERLSVLRILLPLFRAKADPDDPLCEFASTFIPTLIPDGSKFAETVVAEYTRKTRFRVPETMNGNPRGAARDAKQNSAEQLVLLEVLFATMWDYVECDGPIVIKIFEAAYDTKLGSSQLNAPLLLDDEAMQLGQDIAALWTLIMLEVLELETLADPSGLIELSANPREKDVYTASPSSLQRIHELVTSNDDGQYSCVYIAWAFVLSRLAAAVAELDEIPATYRPFFESILPHLSRAYSKDREPAHVIMARTCLMPNAGLLDLMLSFLTNTPLFVASIAWKRASAVTDPNATAYRSVFKGLLIAIIELTPVEAIPQFELFIEVWISLFGRSESKSVALICAQYWESDWHVSSARRAIFDVARARFPIHFKPLIRLLRAMTGAGFLDTDPLCSTQEGPQTRPAAQASVRDSCARHVFYYLETLSTFSQIIPAASSTGPHALYERQPERYGHPHTPIGLSYANQRQIRLPGGSTLPIGSPGRLLSGDGAEFLVVCWQHVHSGWKIVLEVLTDYVNRRRMQSGVGGAYQDVSFARRGATQQVITLRVEDVGVEMDGGGVDETVITDALDLVRSLIQDNPAQAEQLMQSLEAGEAVVAHTMTEAQPPDLVQLTTMILEEALSSSSRQNHQYRTQLITSAMSVLSAILALPRYAHRVWLYIRSTSALFGADRSVGFASVALASERTSGRYTMTLSLLHLVHQLALEAFSSILPDNPRLHQLKEEVLLRAIRFVHTEIWVEHLSWKYAQKAERFDIGEQMMTLYGDILEHAPLTTFPFGVLLQGVVDLLLFKATTSTINPVVSSITTGLSILESLYDSRLLSDVRRLIFSLASHLRLARMVLNLKIHSRASGQPCLLEQALCARITGGIVSRDSHATKTDPIDVLALYVKGRSIGSVVPLEATKVLCALCKSFSMASPSPPTIIAHLNNPETTVASLVRIIQHPYDEMALRASVWNFISLAVNEEPALGSLFVVGQFRTPIQFKGKGKAPEAISDKPVSEEKPDSALDVATDMLAGWSEMWELNPQLLASVLRFLEVVWQHGLEHRAVLEPLRESSDFWERISTLACSELGPLPEHETGSFAVLDGIRRSTHHEVISMHAYRTLVKSYALKIIAHDIGIHFSSSKEASRSKPPSFSKMDLRFRSSEVLSELLSEASPSSYDPELYDQLSQCLEKDFPALTLEQVRSSQPVEEREFGDDFAFSTLLFRTRLHAYRHETSTDHHDSLVAQLHSVNMNLSLTHSQTALADSWQLLLRKAVPYLRGDTTVGPILMTSAASMSYDIAAERRSGDMMATIHGTRLSLLLAVLEVIWFSTAEKKTEVESFVELVHNVHNIILNEAQPPSKSFLGILSVPFHRTLLLILYFCAKNCGILARRPKTLNADQRLRIAAMVDATLVLVIDALRVVFVSARSRLDIELDRDMEFLVSVFEQCTRPDINPSSTLWLIRCQETDIIRASLDLYVHIDLVGLSDLPLLLARNHPLYAPHLLLFHMTLAGIPSAAERFASEGVLTAYSNNSLSAAISAGLVDVVLPEMPTQRSPAHSAYCAMLAIISGVVTALGRHNHYFDAEASGLIQLYGDQIARALSWTIGDSITLPLLEELEQVVNIFYSIAESAPLAPNASPAVEKVLHVFSPHALHLLQQLNYAITHPNHLASMLEPVTSDERALLDKDPPATEPLKRPLIAHLVHRLFRLSSNILSTLVTISRAYTVLTSDKIDWPVLEALIVPHSKVVLGEPASMGTLLELGNCTLDVLRDLVNRPAAQSLADVGSLPGTYPLDVRQGVSTARRNLEALLIYATTQLAMWLSKPDFDVNSSNDMDTEEQADSGRDERRAPRASLSLADRLRRGVTGEMAADLQSLLNKSKPVIAKSDAVLGSAGIDLTQVLLNFLQDRIISPGQ
ncbi:nucleoporin subcomplex protein binding to Pom34-domain-containing protein [Mycena galericulata]|nr:nucleoporin subcomplex protein binding to Pom34-domain-containing protein [Mycena galericulata]